MIASERRRYILGELNSKGVISLKDTARKLGVAEITVRRDFEKLESEGKLKRVQGGAASLEDPDGAELTMSSKMPKNVREKEIAASYAVGLVEEEESVFIDGGTTMIPLAAQLLRKNIRIITYNTMVLKKAIKPTAQIILIGGEYYPSYHMNLGPMAQDMLKQFYFDRAFFGCSGIEPEHQIVYTTETQSLSMKRIAMENSKKNYLLVDSSKFTTRGFVRFCNTDNFENIISNRFEQDRVFPLPGNLIMVPDKK